MKLYSTILISYKNAFYSKSTITIYEVLNMNMITLFLNLNVDQIKIIKINFFFLLKS